MSNLHPSFAMLLVVTTLVACADSEHASEASAAPEADAGAALAESRAGSAASERVRESAAGTGGSTPAADADSEISGDASTAADSASDEPAPAAESADDAAAAAGSGSDGSVPAANSGIDEPAPAADSGAATPVPSAGAEGADPVPPASAETTVPPPIDPGMPSYEVPVSGELAAFSHYPVTTVEWSERNGERRLEYVLPADLVGADQRLEFKGPDSPGSQWTLQGETFGTADCEQTEGQIVCFEMLEGVPIDLNAVDQRVQAGELPAQRLEVSKVFQGDPLGILRFPAP